MALSRITEAVASFTDLTIGDDLTLTDDFLMASDASIIKFGADADVTLTHVADTGLLLNGTSVIQFNDASQNIGAPSATVLDINATDEIELNATLIDINGNVEISGTATTTGVHTFTATPVFSSDITLSDDLNLTSDGAIITFGANSEIALTHVHDTGLILTDSGGSPTLQLHDSAESVSSDGSKLILTSNSVAFSLPTADGSSGQALVTNGSGVISFASVASNTPSSADGQALGSASLEWSDLFLADASTIQFGNDQDVTLTHVADTGLTLNSTSKLMFNDASQYIQGASNTILDIAATDEIELTATLIEIVGNSTISGTLGVTGVLTGTSLDISGAIDVDGTSNLDVVDIDGAVDMASTLQVDGAITGSSTIQGTTITATTAFVPDASDGAALGTTALEFSDLFLADGAVIGLGDDQEVTLTHVADTGLTLNSTNKLMFNDASQFIQGASATVLDIAATDEIELTATLIEIVGNSTVSGTLAVTGVTTSNAGVVVDNITIDGTEIDLSSGDLLVDVAGDITLDAGGGNVKVAIPVTPKVPDTVALPTTSISVAVNSISSVAAISNIALLAP